MRVMYARDVHVVRLPDSSPARRHVLTSKRCSTRSAGGVRVPDSSERGGARSSERRAMEGAWDAVVEWFELEVSIT